MTDTPTREPLVGLAERLHVGDMTLPDYEELLRIIRNAGVTNASKAQAVYEALKPAATALEEQSRRVEELEAALRWIADYARTLRSGTDDWFDLVEVETAARTALSPSDTVEKP